MRERERERDDAEGENKDFSLREVKSGTKERKYSWVKASTC